MGPRNERPRVRLGDASAELGISPRELAAIEAGAAPVPTQLFHRMASVYRRVESVLLLPEPPSDEPLPKDYRTVASAPSTLSPETLFAIRESRRIQHYISDLLEDDQSLLPRAEITSASVDDDPEALAEQERTRFGIAPDTARRWRPGSEAFGRWRDVTQARGILVLVMQMPWDDCRGLSLWDRDLVPTIVINREDAYVARIFTLFHEYAHLMLRESATCLEAQNNTLQGRVERWCKRFAAAFLVPADLLKEEIGRFKIGASGWTMGQVQRAATRFRVSRSVMARRLHELGLSDLYATHSSDLHALDRMPQRRQKEEDTAGGGVKPAVKRFAEIGSAASIVIDAVHHETISAFEAADTLGIGVESLRELENLVASRRALAFGA